MGLETATYVTQLNPANPAQSDNAGISYDHISLIKQCLIDTFPNANAPITATPYQLNYGATVVGMITMFFGTVAPTGWAPCDGGTYTKTDGSGSITTPDLRGTFPLATTATVNGTTPTATLPLGTTGGASSNTPTITVASTTLDQTMIPAHTHVLTDPGHNHTLKDPGHQHTAYDQEGYGGGPNGGYQISGYGGGAVSGTAMTAVTGIKISSATTGITMASVGGNQPHGHTATSTTVPTVPPFFSLMFIMRI